MFMEYINDVIHLTQGELFIKYWWVWLMFIILAVINEFVRNKKKN